MCMCHDAVQLLHIRIAKGFCQSPDLRHKKLSAKCLFLLFNANYYFTLELGDFFNKIPIKAGSTAPNMQA